MISTLAAEWRTLRRGAPGRRFADSYQVGHTARGRRSLLRRIVRIALATACILIGLLLTFLPGPAILFFAVAGALLATESVTIARWLDALELKIRELLHGARVRWAALSTGGRIAVAVVAVILTFGLALFAYRLVFR